MQALRPANLDWKVRTTEVNRNGYLIGDSTFFDPSFNGKCGYNTDKNGTILTQ